MLLQSHQSEDALQPQPNTAASLHTGAQRGALVGLSELGALRQAGVARTLENVTQFFFLTSVLCNVPGCCWYLEGLYIDETQQQARRFG